MKKLTFVILVMAFLSVFSFGQEQELDKHFKKVEVVKLDTSDVLKKISERKPVKIGKFDLKLEYSEVRSKNFKSEVTTAKGTEIAEPVKINTVQGTIVNTASSYAAMTIDDKLEGLVKNSEGMFFVERADKYDKKLLKDDFVLYKQGDKKGGDSILCGVEEVFKSNLQSTQNKLTFDFLDNSSSITASSRLLEVATDADSKYVVLEGGEDQANQRILSVMNMVDITLFAELDINVTVVYQHAWDNEDGPDPYAPNDPTNPWLTYDNFRDHWNSTPRFVNVARDTTILFVGENLSTIVEGEVYSVGGLAIDDTVCKSPVNSYVVIKRDDYFEGNQVRVEINRVVHELAHNLGSEHTPEEGNYDICFDRNGKPPYEFYKQSVPYLCTFRKNNIDAHLTSFGSCLARTTPAPQLPVKQSFDFDGDGKANLASFRPEAFAKWVVQNSFGVDSSPYQYGTTGDTPVAADYDGDRKTDLAVFRPQYTSNQSAFFLRRSALGRIAIYFGVPGDIPVQGDYDGDERTDVAVFRPSNGRWYIYNVLNGQVSSYAFGQLGDVPVQADYDGDGKTDLAVFRPSDSTWYIQKSSGGFYAQPFGFSTDTFVPADYDGDRKMDIAVYRPSTGYWYIQQSSQGYTTVALGGPNDIPIVGDFDGDGKADQAVRYDSSNLWGIRYNSTGSISNRYTGYPSDIPIGFRNPQ